VWAYSLARHPPQLVTSPSSFLPAKLKSLFLLLKIFFSFSVNYANYYAFFFSNKTNMHGKAKARHYLSVELWKEQLERSSRLPTSMFYGSYALGMLSCLARTIPLKL
jgi:hypothetical protein